MLALILPVWLCAWFGELCVLVYLFRFRWNLGLGSLLFTDCWFACIGFVWVCEWCCERRLFVCLFVICACGLDLVYWFRCDILMFVLRDWCWLAVRGKRFKVNVCCCCLDFVVVALFYFVGVLVCVFYIDFVEVWLFGSWQECWSCVLFGVLLRVCVLFVFVFLALAGIAFVCA